MEPIEFFAPMTDAAPTAGGTKDGQGAGDHDQPYRSGRRPSATAPNPFTGWQYARLLVLRGRLLDGALADDRFAV